MKTTLFSAAVFSFVMLAGLVPLRAASEAKTVSITANDTLRFNVSKIEASPGQSIHLQLHNMGTLPKDAMGHNWVLLSADESADDYAAAATNAKADNFQPASLKSKVLAAVPLLGPGETGEVTFTAPAKPGTYPFLCSFPGHFAAGMRGKLIVQ